MCVAGLNVTTQPCAHRWYQLVRSCSTDRNLANCPDKLRLEGWEKRVTECPWCDQETDDNNNNHICVTTHRLFGSAPVGSVPSSPEIPGMLLSQKNRSGSVGTLSTLSSLSRHGSTASIREDERGLRQKELNDRFNLYLTSLPHEILPSAKRNYPTSPRDEYTDSDGASIISAGGILKGWRKSVKIGKGMFKG